MKRVLSIMLTLMLVFTMISGITAFASDEYETVTSFTGGNDFSTIFSSFATVSGFTMQNVSSSFTSLASLEKTAVAADVAAGVTSQKVLALTPSGSTNPTLRFKWTTAAYPNELMRVYAKFYFVGAEGATYDIQMQPQQGTGTTSAGGAYTLSGQAANQWITFDQVVTPTRGTTIQGVKFTITKSGTTEAHPTTVYLDGNIVVEQVKEKAADPSAALDSRFKNNMVFQRNQPIEICGTSTEAGKTVTVTLGDNSATTTTNATGKWSVTLPAMAAQTGLTLNMTCNDEAQTNVNVTNIAIGEIILAAGQSNMNRSVASLYETTIPELADESEEVKAAVEDLANVDVRMLNFNDTNANSYTWARVTKYEKTSAGDSIYHRSLIGFMTAYKLAKAEGITVAFADAAIGGAHIEAFFSPETLAGYSSFTPADPSVTTIENLKTVPQGLYNAWLSHIKGMKFGSVIWYQGETNAIEGATQEEYYNMLTDLINQFRRDYKNANLPVAVVQLAPHSNNKFIAARQAQLDVANDMNNVYLISTADAGLTATETDVDHPVNKMPVINRAFNIIKYALKGENVEYSSPLYKKMVVNGNEATLTFSRAYGYDLLKTSSVASLSDTSAAAGYSRFGGSSAERWEFRCDPVAVTDVFATRMKAAELTADYANAVEGYPSNYTFVKLTRHVNASFVRISQLVTNDQIKVGDKFRITVKVYPTDMMLSEDVRDTNNTVESFKWTYKGQRNGSSGHGDDIIADLIPNQWNTIILEDTAANDGVNGIYFNTDAYAGAFPGTVLFDGVVTLEKLASADVETKSLKTSDGGAVKGFQIAGADGTFYDADATINGNQIIVSSENVASPVEVRYCYVSWDENDHSTLGGNVVNAAGLPLVPFKANAAAVEIDSVTGSGYNYTVKLSNDVYNTAPGYVVAALYDGDVLVQVKTVKFTINERRDSVESVTFNPATAPSKPEVKIMAWKDITRTLVPYCAAK